MPYWKKFISFQLIFTNIRWSNDVINCYNKMLHYWIILKRKTPNFSVTLFRYPHVTRNEQITTGGHLSKARRFNLCLQVVLEIKTYLN